MDDAEHLAGPEQLLRSWPSTEALVSLILLSSTYRHGTPTRRHGGSPNTSGVAPVPVVRGSAHR
jgi:hypothetical protein